jgi:hypothetical protein
VLIASKMKEEGQVLRLNDILGKPKHERRREDSTWESLRVDNEDKVDWSLVTLRKTDELQ